MFKNKLKQTCESIIEKRIASAKLAIHDAQQAANNEEKSSAGDKYETSRAMNHLEKDMHGRQMIENLKELSMIRSIDVTSLYTTGMPGAFVQCTSVSFFIAAGLGKQKIEDSDIIFLSPHAPLAKLLMHKKAGDFFLFNGIQTQVTEIY